MAESYIPRERSTFRKLFPRVKSLLLTGKEHGNFNNISIIPLSAKGKLHYTESNIPAEIRCSNPRCQQGGYKIQTILETIIQDENNSYENTFHCNGLEGKKNGQPCENHIEIYIKLVYEP